MIATSSHATTPVFDIIRLHGYSLGTTRVLDPRTMQTQAVVNATRPDGSQSWTVQMDSEFEARSLRCSVWSVVRGFNG